MLRQVVLLACCFTVVLSECGTNIDNVSSALEKVVNYVLMNNKYMNLDAVFGLVLGEAHLSMIISNNIAPNNLLDQVQNIEKKLQKALTEAKSNLKRTQKNTLFSNTVLALEAWTRNITFKNNQLIKGRSRKLLKINTYSEYMDYLATSNFNEQDSDDCIMDLLQEQNYCCMKHKCIVSDECYAIMRLNDYQRIDPLYGVTHSLLFLQLARSQECAMNTKVLSKKILRFCSYIYWELVKNSDLGFLSSLDDLLLEQVTLCGYEGFAEFFGSDIINHAVGMQKPSGCFSLQDDQTEKYENTERMRKKREGNRINGGCIDHTTGLGVSTLTIFLRYLLQTANDTECHSDRQTLE